MTEHDDVPTVRGDEPEDGDEREGGEDTGDDGSGGGLESRVLLARARSRLLGRTPEPVRVGRYRILQRLGQGGMGVVYLAHDDELDRRVAIKILRHDLAPSTAGRSRLLREAQATARLSHPNVVHVYEVGHEADQVYMAMEYIEGDTLRRWCAVKRRAWSEIVAMHLAAGEALAAAHAVGLVHRDFKPDNVLVGLDGRPRVVDFGLARADEATITGESHASASTRAPLDVTATATLAGTPAYMAPEQHARQPADPRSDQFAFAVTLFEALYGQRPFAGNTLTELAVRVAEGVQTEVDPVARGVPLAVHEVVMRGLARHPRQRFADMPELLFALRRGATPPVRRAWWPLAAIGAGALGVVALAQMSTSHTPAPIVDEPASIEPDAAVSPWAPILDASDLPAPIPAPLAGDATGVTVHRLDNGLTVYIAHRPAEPTITAHVAIRAGVEDVPPEDQGMAGLVLDVMLQGSQRIGTTSWAHERPFVAIEHALLRSLELSDDPAQRKDIERLIEAAQLGARTLRIPYEPVTVGNELGFRRQTVLGGIGATFSAEVPAHRIGAWAELVAEMLQRPSFRAFASTTAARLELIRWVNQDTLGDRAALHAFAPTVGRKYDPVLAADVMRRLPLTRAQAFHREYFRPNNTAIVLVGDITATEALPLLESHFAAWEPAAIPQAGLVRTELPDARTVKTIETGGWSMIELAWALPPGAAEEHDMIALGHALGGREGLVAEALGLRDPSDVMVIMGRNLVRVSVATRPDDSHADIERKIVEMLRQVAGERIDDVVWTRALARAGLESQRWARSRRNLALEIEGSFLHRQPWAEAAERLSQAPTRADVVAGAKAVLERPMVVVDQRPGEPFMIDVEPIAVSPMQLVLDERSAWARRLLDEPTTPSEPRFLVAGSHYESTPHGAGRVVTTRHAGPLFHLDWIAPVGARSDPWACDAVRAKVRAVPVAGVDVDATCTNDDSRITIIGPSARFEAVWPDLLAWLTAPAIPAKDLDAHIVDALRWRADERTHALWGSESMHLWALRGEQGIDAHLPDDATLRRRGAVEIAASMDTLSGLAPDILYTGPTPELVRAVLPAPSERTGPPSEPFRFREQSEPTIVLLHEPGRPQAEVRVLVPQIRPEGRLRERIDDAQAELAAQMYEFMGDRSVEADDSLVRLELQVWVPPDGGGSILHGIGYRCTPGELDSAIETAIAFLQRPPDPEGFRTAQARVEADFRAVRVPPHMIPEHVHRWGRGAKADGSPTQDPRIAQWLALPGLSYETFAAYVAEVARATPYVSIVADVDAIDMAALRRHGRVIQPDLDDILRDSRQSELDILGVGLVNTNPD